MPSAPFAVVPFSGWTARLVERWSLETPLAAAECRARLEARRVLGLRLGESAERPLLGSVSPTAFSLYRAIRSRSPVLIVAEGELTPMPAGTRVLVELHPDRLQLLLALALTVGVALLLVLGRSAFDAPLADAWPIGLLLLAALGLSVGLSARGAAADRAFLLACIRDALEATRAVRIDDR